MFWQNIHQSQKNVNKEQQRVFNLTLCLFLKSINAFILILLFDLCHTWSRLLIDESEEINSQFNQILLREFSTQVQVQKVINIILFYILTKFIQRIDKFSQIPDHTQCPSLLYPTFHTFAPSSPGVGVHTAGACSRWWGWRPGQSESYKL